MATYYMRADGALSSKTGATSDANASTSMDAAAFNGDTFATDDIVIVSDLGGTYSGDTLDLDGRSDLTLQANSGGSPKFENTTQIVSMELAYRVTLDGIEFEKTGGYAYAIIRASNPGDDCIVRNCIVHGADDGGLAVGDFSDARRDASGWLVEDNVFYDNGTAGTNFVCGPGDGPGYDLTNCIFRRNTCYDNSDWNGGFGGGMKFFGNFEFISGFQVYENLVYSNGRPQQDGNQSDGVGIYFDGCIGTVGNPNLIHDNLVYDNGGNGIFVEISHYTYVYSNVCCDNGFNANGQDEFLPANIVVDARDEGSSPLTAKYNKIIGNSCYGGQCGIKCSSYSNEGSIQYLVDNEFANNICSGYTLYGLSAQGGGDNDINGNGNTYDNNCFGAEPDPADDFIEWGNNTRYETYDSWLAASGADSGWTYVDGDPLFTNPTSNDLTLQSGSPCRGQGDNTLGSPFNMGLLPTSVWPDAVETDDRDNY